MSNHSRDLAYFVTPKSGPLPPLKTLGDANRAFLELPFRARRKPHWAIVGRLLLAASESGDAIDIRWVTDALVQALEAEGWMSHR